MRDLIIALGFTVTWIMMGVLWLGEHHPTAPQPATVCIAGTNAHCLGETTP